MKYIHVGPYYRVAATVRPRAVVFQIFSDSDAPSVPNLGRCVGYRKRRWFWPFGLSVESAAVLTVMKAQRLDTEHEEALQGFDWGALTTSVSEGLKVIKALG